MPIAYIRPINPVGPLVLVEIIPIGPGDPPPRPTPGPTPPTWQPGDPYPTPPIFYPPGTGPGYPGWAPGDPNRPHPEFPIVLPPTGPGEPPVVLPVKSVEVALVPPPQDGSPIPQPPPGLPAGSKLMYVRWGPGEIGQGWMMPYPTQGPVQPPPA